MSLQAISDQLNDQNKELLSQGEVMKENNTQLETLNRNFSNFLIKLESNETDELETQAEERLEKSRARQAEARPKTSGNLFGSMENTLMGLGIPGMGALLGRGLVGGLVRGGLAYIMAEAVADYLNSQGFSEEVSDAVGRGLTGYGILRVFGKRLGAIGLIGGALATPENIEATKTQLTKLVESFEIGWGKFSTWFDGVFGVEGLIPTTDEIVAKINNIVGDSLTGLNAFLRGDFNSEEFYKNLDDMAITFGALALMLKPGGTLKVLVKSIAKLAGAALALSGLNKAAKSLVPPGTTPGVTTASKAKLDRGQLTQQAGKLSAKQLSAEGLYKAKDGAIIDKKTNKVVSAERLNSAVTNADAASKFPRVAKFLRAPGIGYLFGAYDIYSILNSPGSMESKIAPLAGVLSAVLGSGGGAMLGAALGSVFPGPGTLVGGALGGIAGWLGAEAVGKGLAQFMLGQKVDSFGYGFGWVNDMLNGIGAPKGQAPDLSGYENPSAGYTDPIMNAAKMQPSSADALSSAQKVIQVGPAGAGAVAIGGDSYNIIGGSETMFLGGGQIGVTEEPAFGRK